MVSAGKMLSWKYCSRRSLCDPSPTSSHQSHAGAVPVPSQSHQLVLIITSLFHLLPHHLELWGCCGASIAQCRARERKGLSPEIQDSPAFSEQVQLNFNKRFFKTILMILIIPEHSLHAPARFQGEHALLRALFPIFVSTLNIASKLKSSISSLFRSTPLPSV